MDDEYWFIVVDNSVYSVELNRESRLNCFYEFLNVSSISRCASIVLKYCIWQKRLECKTHECILPCVFSSFHAGFILCVYLFADMAITANHPFFNLFISGILWSCLSWRWKIVIQSVWNHDTSQIPNVLQWFSSSQKGHGISANIFPSLGLSECSLLVFHAFPLNIYHHFSSSLYYVFLWSHYTTWP